MFSYCVGVLHFDEGRAYKMINVARAGREFPILFEMIGRGALHITGINMLTKYLTLENHRELLTAAAFKTKRQIQELIAARFPIGDVPTTIRKLPPGPAQKPARESPVNDMFSKAPAPAVPLSEPPSEPRPLPPPAIPFVAMPKSTITPTAPSRYKITLTADDELMGMIEEAKALMRHQIPDGDIAKVLKRALPQVIAKLRKQKHGETNSPRVATPAKSTTTRHVPNAVKREVTRQHGAQCGFVSTSGHRCEERSMLELHHIEPFALGGTHDPANLRWFCRAHNRHAADRDFGPEHIKKKIEARRATTREVENKIVPEREQQELILVSAPNLH
jgi:hypothetical protein